jgi:hypothetical protein
MASPPVAGSAPVGVATRRGVLRLSVLPLAFGAVAIVVGALVGDVWAGALFAVGLFLGAVNGFAAQVATVRLAHTEGADRSAIVRGSLRRLGLVTLVAIAIAFLARPTGWLVLLGLAGYQLLSTAVTAGATMRELRRG